MSFYKLETTGNLGYKELGWAWILNMIIDK